MAWDSSSWKLYTDAALTTLYGGVSTFSHKNDLSDGAQDRVLYFCSKIAGRQLQALSNPGVDNIMLTVADVLPEWVADATVALGATVEPTVDNTYRYVCTTAGVSAGVEPVWPTAIGSTVADGGVVWTCVAKSHQPSEIKLATSLAGLDSATGGAAVSLGVTLESGEANVVELHMRVTNTVTTVSNNVGYAEINLTIDALETVG